MLTADHFDVHLDSDFVAAFDDGTSLALRLVAVKRSAPRDFPGRLRDPFFLLFHNPGPYCLYEATYRLVHGRMGPIDLFLLPVGDAPGGGYTMQASFD